MNQDKDETIRITRTVTRLPLDIAETVYREQMPMFSLDGHFDAKALAVVKRTYSDLALLDQPPDMATLYTEEFLPKSAK